MMEKIFSYLKTQHVPRQTCMHNSWQIIVYIFDIGFFIKAYPTVFKMYVFCCVLLIFHGSYMFTLFSYTPQNWNISTLK